jgi:MarR family transcriptional regulator, organic hydroperoxide resistance regulator
MAPPAIYCIDNITLSMHTWGVRDQFVDDGIILDNALAFWIHRVYQATRNASFEVLRAEGEEVTPEQWIVLVRLWEQDGRTQTELGESTFRDRPTMSRILAGMERRGLVRRKSDPENARVWRVFLAARGRELRGALVPRARELVERSLRGIPVRDLEITRTTLRRMFENLTGE